MSHRRRIRRALLLVVVSTLGAAIGVSAYAAAAPEVRVAVARAEAPEVGDCLDVPVGASAETGEPEATGAPYVVDCSADHHLQVLSVQEIPADVAAWLPDRDTAWVGIGGPGKDDPSDGVRTFRLTPLKRFEETACGRPDAPFWASSAVVHKMVYPSRSRWEWDAAPSLCVVSLADYDGERSGTHRIPGGIDLAGQWWDSVPESVWRLCKDGSDDLLPCDGPGITQIAVVDTPMTGSTGGADEELTTTELATPVPPADRRGMYLVCRTAMFHLDDVFPPTLTMTVPYIPTPSNMDYSCFLPVEYLSQYSGKLDRSVLAPEAAK